MNNNSSRRELGNRIFKRHRNLWVYMVFGFIAALINTVVFMAMHAIPHTVLVIDNTVAFIVSNLASFWFNHKAVFVITSTMSISCRSCFPFYLPDSQPAAGHPADGLGLSLCTGRPLGQVIDQVWPGSSTI